MVGGYLMSLVFPCVSLAVGAFLVAVSCDD